MIEQLTDFFAFYSLVVMDYDEFSKDDFIGATAVNLYELEFAQTSSLTLRRLLDDMVGEGLRLYRLLVICVLFDTH